MRPCKPRSRPDARTPRQLAFRKRHDVETSAPANFDEVVIKPGVKITLRGVVRFERQPEATERGYRDDAPAKRRLVSLPQQPVTVLRIW